MHEQQKTSSTINQVGFQEMSRIRGRTLGVVPSNNQVTRAVLSFLLKHVWVDMLYRIKSRLRS